MSVTTLSPTAVPTVLPSDEGERIWITADTVRIVATVAESGGSFTTLEVVSPPGSGPPPHIHETEDEAFYVLDGEFELVIGERVVRGGAGTYAIAPRGIVHRFQSTGDRDGRLLVTFTPGGIEGFFRHAGTPATGDGPPPPLDASEIARTEAAGRQYGLRVVEWST